MTTDTGNETGKRAKRAVQLRLNTPQNCRKSLARLIRDFHSAPDSDIQHFRAEVYALRTMADYWTVESQLRAVSMLDKLDAFIAAFDRVKGAGGGLDQGYSGADEKAGEANDA